MSQEEARWDLPKAVRSPASFLGTRLRHRSMSQSSVGYARNGV
jgi:hypothetical protein